MKKHYIFCLSLIFTLIACSPSSNSNSNQQNSFGYFDMIYNGNMLQYSEWSAEKDGSYYRVYASKYENNSERNDISILFHEDGTLIDIQAYDRDILNYYSAPFFIDNYLDFSIVDINASDNTLKIQFNGDLSFNRYVSVGSGSVTVNSSVYAEFQNISPNLPSIASFGTTATINGNSWRGLGRRDETPDYYYTEIQGDDQYVIYLHVPKNQTLSTGTFNFTNSNMGVESPYVIFLYKYNEDLGENYDNMDYNSSGTMTISEVGVNYIKGTFSFTSVDPNTGDTVTVTNGVFSERYR
ncbi:DUF6252 family protein [Flavobacterium sp. NRK F10]|uniref:DUF6252 family protein n=1 Tax=Flavobacterium sp. NRK F10 TaxID=2954931 RepID=UPI002090D48C|nr:DUF6252 family protein [Flavobacterium sp. NRK F10]MCO6175069.1 DUF6252 family protein [Flavobacterium sp. NRK F10]